MRHYEETLSKIAPTFFKLEQYYEYYDNHYTLMMSYLKYMKLPEVYTLYLPANNIYYYYLIKKDYSYISYMTESQHIIMLTTIEERHIYNPVTLAELIINIIINDFYFENEHPTDRYYNSIKDFKKIFIALVGDEMYDTIRENIR